jgi:hypothetical protein
MYFLNKKIFDKKCIYFIKRNKPYVLFDVYAYYVS